MKILALHTEYIRFKPLKKALKNIADLTEKERKPSEVKDALAILTSVEKNDTDVNEVAKELVKNIKDIAEQVKAKNIVLYPYAHLSKNLASPDIAIKILETAEKELGKTKSLKVTRAPFGYYKEFELKVKGHPLSELSREISIDSSNSKKPEKEEYNPEEFLHEIKQSPLDTSKLKSNDHRIIGQQMELFLLNQSSPGMPYWLPNGTKIYNELIKFWREFHSKRGYEETITPLINKSSLYKISGHWTHYKENMFISKTDEGDYGLKAMNCPNAMVIFRSKTRSYKDLPLRLSDTDKLHRYELSGTLNGLLRVRSFQQDDSHNFITEDMIKSEYEEIFRICEKFYSIFGLDYSFRLGTRPDKFLGESKTWDKAEKNLKEILKKSGKKFTIAEGDGAFYGPKVDIIMKDSLGREWQMGTVQLDFQLPQRFGLKYVDKDGKDKIPVVIHRVIYGSLERFIGILLEHTNGSLPIWLSPVQVRVIDFTERNTKAAQKIMEEIKKAIPEIRIDSDFRNTTVNDKVRDAEMQKVPLIIVIGDKEEKSNTLALRKRGEKPEFEVKLDSFIKETKGKIENRN